MKEIQVKSWKELTEIFDKQNHRNRFWVYRGQKNSDWTLSPTIERTGLKIFEPEILKSFKRNAHLHLNTNEIDTTLEWLSILQHYGAPTRLLDWTYSPYVACFFALIEKDISSNDCSIWAINIDALTKKAIEISKETSKFNFLQNSNYRFEREFTESDFSDIFMSNKFQPFILPATPKRGHERLNIQQGVFLCQTDFNSTYEENLKNAMKLIGEKEKFNKIIIPASLKSEILDKLRHMNITYENLFPGLEGFIKSLSLKHQIFLDSSIMNNFWGK